jgi:hypothetical protein
VKGIFMYERHNQPLLPTRHFIKRQLNHMLIVLAIIAGSLAIGMVGDHLTEGLNWIDAFLNSAMLLGGMGPVNALQTNPGKIFAGIYALYSASFSWLLPVCFLLPCSTACCTISIWNLKINKQEAQKASCIYYPISFDAISQPNPPNSNRYYCRWPYFAPPARRSG